MAENTNPAATPAATPAAPAPAAAPAATPAAVPAPASQLQSFDYDRLDQMIAKGIAQKENAILKSVFDQEGISAEDAKQLIADFKAKKAAAEQEKANATANLKAENERLKAEIFSGKLNAALSKVANELGVKAENVPYLSKLADLTKVANDKGEVDEGLVKQSIETVLKDFPMFKGNDGANSGFVPVGASGSPAGSPAEPQTKGPAQKPWNRFNH